MDAKRPALDNALHAPPRIGIMTRLLIHRVIRFSDLQKSVGLTSGNLSSHLAGLEAAGYVRQRDGIVALRRARIVELTSAGDQAFRRYVSALEEVLRSLKSAEAASPAAGMPSP